MKTIPDPFDIDACCKHNRNAMLNTATGRWLAAACREIEALRMRVEQLEEATPERCGLTKKFETTPD